MWKILQDHLRRNWLITATVFLVCIPGAMFASLRLFAFFLLLAPFVRVDNPNSLRGFYRGIAALPVAKRDIVCILWFTDVVLLPLVAFLGASLGFAVYVAIFRSVPVNSEWVVEMPVFCAGGLTVFFFLQPRRHGRHIYRFAVRLLSAFVVIAAVTCVVGFLQQALLKMGLSPSAANATVLGLLVLNIACIVSSYRTIGSCCPDEHFLLPSETVTPGKRRTERPYKPLWPTLHLVKPTFVWTISLTTLVFLVFVVLNRVIPGKDNAGILSWVLPLAFGSAVSGLESGMFRLYRTLPLTRWAITWRVVSISFGGLAGTFISAALLAPIMIGLSYAVLLLACVVAVFSLGLLFGVFMLYAIPLLGRIMVSLSLGGVVFGSVALYAFFDPPIPDPSCSLSAWIGIGSILAIGIAICWLKYLIGHSSYLY